MSRIMAFQQPPMGSLITMQATQTLKFTMDNRTSKTLSDLIVH